MPSLTLPTPVVPPSSTPGAGRLITIISASVGAGHDGAARGIAQELTAAGFTVAMHDFLDLMPGRTGRWLCRAYATQLRVAPRTWGTLLRVLERSRGLATFATALSALVAGRGARAAIGPHSAAVISTYPLASQALGRLRRRGAVTVPVITFLTDMSVHPLWVASGIDQHLALHEVPARQAEELKAAGVSVCARAVDPAFRPARDEAEVLEARRRFGLPAGPLALVVAGSWGVGEVARTAREIAASGVATPVTVCGHNEQLRKELTDDGIGVVLGWVDEMPVLMRAADVVVQNAGGLSTQEAMASGVPLVSYRCVPGHGITNAEALEQAGLARWVRDQAELPAALSGALAPPGSRSGAEPRTAPPKVLDIVTATIGAPVGISALPRPRVPAEAVA